MEGAEVFFVDDDCIAINLNTCPAIPQNVDDSLVCLQRIGIQAFYDSLAANCACSEMSRRTAPIALHGVFATVVIWNRLNVDVLEIVVGDFAAKMLYNFDGHFHVWTAVDGGYFDVRIFASLGQRNQKSRQKLRTLARVNRYLAALQDARGMHRGAMIGERRGNAELPQRLQHLIDRAFQECAAACDCNVGAQHRTYWRIEP